jgi:hypothetical protein
MSTYELHDYALPAASNLVLQPCAGSEPVHSRVENFVSWRVGLLISICSDTREALSEYQSEHFSSRDLSKKGSTDYSQNFPENASTTLLTEHTLQLQHQPQGQNKSDSLADFGIQSNWWMRRFVSSIAPSVFHLIRFPQKGQCMLI